MKTQWYSLKRGEPQASGSAAAAELRIEGDIGPSWWEETTTAASLVKDLAALGDVSEIRVTLNSLGGSVPDGMAIFNALRRHPARIVTRNEGVALSIASLIFMAGDEREMSENAMFMFHAPWTYADGNAQKLRDAADTLDKWAEAMAASYAVSGKSYEDCLSLLTDGKDHYFTAAEALAEGFVTAITETSAPAAQAAFRLMADARFASNPHAAKPAQLSRKEPETMTLVNPAPSAAAKTEDQIRAEALAQDAERRNAIAAAALPFARHEGMSELVAKLQADLKMGVEAANREILAALAKGVEPVAGQHFIEVEETGLNNRIAAQCDALMVRAGVAGKDVRDRVNASHNPFRADSLLDMARASLDRAGVKHAGRDKMQIAAAAFSQTGSDFPILLENVMHRALQSGYALAPDTWTRFAKRGSVSDFKANNRYRVGSLGNLDALNELGEFKNKTIPDGEKASISASTKGNIINISRQVIVNDDLGAFIGLADMLGRAAKRTVEADVYALLAQNGGLGPKLSDGKPLFDEAHGNIGTAAALAVAALDADRVLMRKQKDVSGNDYLDLQPAVLLVSVGLGGVARVIVNAEYDPDTANKLQRPNVVRGMVSDIVDSPRLDGTRRYLFADPNVAPVIEVVFLDGNDQPFLDTEVGFGVDGSRHKVRLDYGVGATDYRGAVTNAGA